MKKIKIINRNSCTKLFAVIVIMFLAINGFAQARSQADVNITAVTITAAKPSRATTTGEFSTSRDQPGVKIVPGAENLKCAVTVHSYWDDDAHDAMLVVVVPVEVTIVSLPANATVYKAGGGTSPWAGYIVFNLGNMAVQQSITVEFIFTKSPTGNNKVGAYAYSATPDPNPANNYKDATY
jgi:hypothetical protein